MSLVGTAQRIDVLFGAAYRAAVIYAPQGPRLHLLRADGRYHRLDEPRAARAVQGAAAGGAWGDVAGTFRRPPERVLVARPPRPSTLNAKHVLAAFAFFLFLAAPAPRAQVNATAITIVGGELADGTGAAVRRANVRIVNDRIVGAGQDVKPLAGDTVIDATGLVVAPGFIDIHNHSANELAPSPRRHRRSRRASPRVFLGPDGSSPWPIGEYLDERRGARRP